MLVHTRHFGKCHHLRELLRGDGAEGDHRQWHFFVAWPHFCRGLLLKSLTAIRVGETHEKKTDLETQMATRSSKLEVVVFKSRILDSKFVELLADLGLYACCQYFEKTGKQMMLKLAMLYNRSCVTFARVELLKSFPESTKKTDVVLVVMAWGTLPNKLGSGLKCLRTHEEVTLPSIGDSGKGVQRTCLLD